MEFGQQLHDFKGGSAQIVNTFALFVLLVERLPGAQFDLDFLVGGQRLAFRWRPDCGPPCVWRLRSRRCLPRPSGAPRRWQWRGADGWNAEGAGLRRGMARLGNAVSGYVRAFRAADGIPGGIESASLFHIQAQRGHAYPHPRHLRHLHGRHRPAGARRGTSRHRLRCQCLSADEHATRRAGHRPGGRL